MSIRAAGLVPAVVQRVHAGAARPQDAALVARALLLAPRAGSLRLLRAVSGGGRPEAALALLRVLAALAMACLCLSVVVLAGPLLLLVAVPACAGAVALPGLAVGRTARRGVEAATGALPLALELTAAGLRAGLPVDQALAVAAGCGHPSLDGLLGRAAAYAAAGGLAATGLAEAAATGGVDGIATVAALIDRRQRLGLPVAAALLAVADAERARTRAETLTRAARRGPLAALVTATIVAPACALGLLCVVVAGLLADGRVLGLG